MDNNQKNLEINKDHQKGETKISFKNLSSTAKKIIIGGVVVTIVLGQIILSNLDMSLLINNRDNYISIDNNYMFATDKKDVKFMEIDLTTNNITSLYYLKDFDNLETLEIQLDANSINILNTIPRLKSLKSLKLYSKNYDFERVFIDESQFKFLSNCSTINELTLQIPFICPYNVFEKYCPDVTKINIYNWFLDSYHIDFTKFEKLKTLNIKSSSTETVSANFTKKDYEKLLNKGVDIIIDEYTSFKAIEIYWRLYDKYNKYLNIDPNDTPKEIIDTIMIKMINGEIAYDNSLNTTNTFKALTSMNNIKGYVIKLPQENIGSYNYGCILDINNDKNYYFFDPYTIIQDNNDMQKQLIASYIKNSSNITIDGYMNNITLEEMSDVQTKGDRKNGNNKYLR